MTNFVTMEKPGNPDNSSLSLFRRFLYDVGSGFIGGVRHHLYIMSMLYEAALLAVQPSSWVYPVRVRMARQILFAGVEAIPITTGLALLAGASVYMQCLIWLQFTGNTQFLGDMVGTILFREAAPFLATFVVIGASASAITTELANMKTSGEVALLESQGINIFQYLALPRILGLACCVLGLSLIFVAVSLVSSVLGFALFSPSALGGSPFMKSMWESVGATEWISLVAKSLFPGLFMGAICCYEGLRVSGVSTEVPQAVSRSILHSMSYTVIIWGIAILITYLV